MEETTVSFYKEMINTLIQKYDFSSFLCDRTSDSLQEWYASHSHEFGCEFGSCFFDWGMTKLCFGDPNTGFVVKIPFENKAHDYCEWEVENYRAAVSNLLDSHFAKCDLFYFIPLEGKTIPVYIMEYVDCNEDACAEYIKSTYPEMAEEYNVDYGVCVECVEDFLRVEWGDEEFDRFLEFADEVGINDIHGANIGQLENGEWVLIDYSGYCG